jgi:hypothetical protein
MSTHSRSGKHEPLYLLPLQIYSLGQMWGGCNSILSRADFDLANSYSFIGQVSGKQVQSLSLINLATHRLTGLGFLSSCFVTALVRGL